MAKKSAFLSLDDERTIALIDEVALWSAPFGRLLLDNVEYRNGMKFLDIGPGTGFPLIELAQRLHRSEAYGIDPWDKGRERIESKCALLKLHNVTVVKGGAESLPFVDGFFDLIVSNNGLNNVSDTGTVLDECRRTLKKNARLLFTINLPGTMKEFYSAFKHVLRKNGLDRLIGDVDRHIGSKRLSRREWLRLLHMHGFRKVRTVTEEFSYKFSDAAAMFDHFFMKIAFIPSWEAIVGETGKEKIFDSVIAELNESITRGGCLALTIPMICFDCTK